MIPPQGPGRRHSRLHGPPRHAAFVSVALALLLTLPPSLLHGRTPLRIGMQDRIAHAVLTLAQARGDFAAEGLQVQLLGPSSTDEPDLRAVSADALIEAEAAGVALRGALLLGEARAADVLLGEPGLQSAAGLRGARIGMVSGATGRLLLAAELQRRGLSLEDVQLEQLTVDQAIERWRAPGDSPALQGIVVAAPASVLLQDALAGGGAADAAHPIVRLGDGARNSGLIIDVLAGEERWLRSNKEELKAVIRAWSRAVDALRQDPQASLALLAESTGTPVPVLQRSLDGVDLYGVQENIRRLRGDFQKRFSSMSQVLARTRGERARGVPSTNRYLSLAALRQVAAGR